MDSISQLITANPNIIWAAVAIAGIAFAGMKAWFRHVERIEKIRAGQDPDQAA
ncbi:MAG: hypothetical protein HYV16_05935 [Gammaproteobacteria bacterium]|nr:hypothetical protein [Gammaproteobacteria bacterium]